MGGQTIAVADIAVVAAAPEGRVFAVVESNPAQVVELLHPVTDDTGIRAAEIERRHLMMRDLAADQCTLFMSDVFGGIRRFDVCEGKFLADFRVSQFSDRRPIHILPDGGVLYGLIRYDANGSAVGNLRIRTSLVGMAFALTRGGTRIRALRS